MTNCTIPMGFSRRRWSTDKSRRSAWYALRVPCPSPAAITSRSPRSVIYAGQILRLQIQYAEVNSLFVRFLAVNGFEAVHHRGEGDTV